MALQKPNYRQSSYKNHVCRRALADFGCLSVSQAKLQPAGSNRQEKGNFLEAFTFEQFRENLENHEDYRLKCIQQHLKTLH